MRFPKKKKLQLQVGLRESTRLEGDELSQAKSSNDNSNQRGSWFLAGHVKTRLLSHVRNMQLQFSAQVYASCALLIFSSYSSSIVLFFIFLFKCWLLQFPVGLVLNYLTLYALWLIRVPTLMQNGSPTQKLGFSWA